MKELTFRPQASEKKIHSKNEFELCYIRHKYLRKVDYNPTAAEMQPYMRVVEHLARNTYYTYKNLFSLVGFEREDVANIARVHLVSFLGLFSLEKMDKKYIDFLALYTSKYGETPSELSIQNKNKANLTMFIKQRMEDVVRICRQKARNIKGLPVEEFYVFYGPKKPPKILRLLLENHEKYGFKKLDLATFKSIKKKMKIKNNEAFKFAGFWYVTVPLEHRPLSITDFAGAGIDPRDSIHNRNPEEALIIKRKEEEFERKKAVFSGHSDERKIRIMRDFIRKNKKNPELREEVGLAKKYLRSMRKKLDRS